MKRQIITACAFIYNKQGQLLIAKRAKTKKFLPDKFEFVGGHVEFGETLENCLVRETKEELHIDILVEDIFYAFTYIDGYEHIVEVDYFARIVDEAQKIVLNPEDHSEYKWISKKKVNDSFSPEDDELGVVLKGFEKFSNRS